MKMHGVNRAFFKSRLKINFNLYQHLVDLICLVYLSCLIVTQVLVEEALKRDGLADCHRERSLADAVSAVRGWIG